MKLSKTVAVVPGMVPMRRSRPIRNPVPRLILVCLSGLVSACIIPTRVGGFPVTGTVVDRCTGAPVEGVGVFLRYSSVNAYEGDTSQDTEPVFTNQLGEFYMPPKRLTLMAGSGGLAGEASKWPTLTYYKRGYKSVFGYSPQMIANMRYEAPVDPRKYQTLVLEIQQNGQNCPVGSRPHEGA